jgi:hypothetical protein
VPYNNGHRSHAKWALRILLTLVEMRNAATAPLHQDLLDQGLVQQLVEFLDTPVPAKADPLYLELRTAALLIISGLCRHRRHAQELFGEAGVSMLGYYLQSSQDALATELGHRELLVAAVDATWCVPPPPLYLFAVFALAPSLPCSLAPLPPCSLALYACLATVLIG